MHVNQDTHYLAAELVAQILQDRGYESYIIGGAVRDLLLNHPPKDYDIVTNAKPEDLLKIPEFVNPKYTDPAQAYGVTRAKIAVANELVPIEITTYRKDIESHLGRKLTKIVFADIADDIERRDFTINALALDPLNHFLLDEVGGLDDLDKRYIRFIGKPEIRIKEDPLRVLRAIRFKSRLGFRYADDTFDALTQSISNGVLPDIATDRLRNEISSMLIHSTREEALEDLDTFGIIKQILPELEATKNIDQPGRYHSEGDVFRHSTLAVRYLPDQVSERLVWATLLHDIGKAPTFTPAEITGDRIRFNQHHSESAKLAKIILKRLNFSNKLTDEITWMIHYHMAIAYLPQMRPGHAANFMNHPAFADLLELHRADAHAAWNKSDNKISTTEPDLSEIEKIHDEYKKTQLVQNSSSLKDIGIDGHWVLENFPDIQKGERLGKVLNELKLSYAEGNLQTKEDAYYLANKFIQTSNR